MPARGKTAARSGPEKNAPPALFQQTGKHPDKAFRRPEGEGVFLGILASRTSPVSPQGRPGLSLGRWEKSIPGCSARSSAQTRAGLFARQPILDSIRKDVLESSIFSRMRVAMRWGVNGGKTTRRELQPGLQLKKGARRYPRSPVIAGRDERIRTSGLRVPNAALYQAEPHPDC